MWLALRPFFSPKLMGHLLFALETHHSRSYAAQTGGCAFEGQNRWCSRVLFSAVSTELQAHIFLSIGICRFEHDLIVGMVDVHRNYKAKDCAEGLGLSRLLCPCLFHARSVSNHKHKAVLRWLWCAWPLYVGVRPDVPLYHASGPMSGSVKDVVGTRYTLQWCFSGSVIIRST